MPGGIILCLKRHNFMPGADMGKIHLQLDLSPNPNPQPKKGFNSKSKIHLWKKDLTPNPKSFQKDFKSISNPFKILLLKKLKKIICFLCELVSLFLPRIKLNVRYMFASYLKLQRSRQKQIEWKMMAGKWGNNSFLCKKDLKKDLEILGQKMDLNPNPKSSLKKGF